MLGLDIIERVIRPIGGYVDQSGVALTNGGGTLVLGTHDNVSSNYNAPERNNDSSIDKFQIDCRSRRPRPHA